MVHICTAKSLTKFFKIIRVEVAFRCIHFTKDVRYNILTCSVAYSELSEGNNAKARES